MNETRTTKIFLVAFVLLDCYQDGVDLHAGEDGEVLSARVKNVGRERGRNGKKVYICSLIL